MPSWARYAPRGRGRVAAAALLLGLGCADDPVDLTRPPTAFAGFDGQAALGADVALDGSQSIDPDGDPLAFSWRMVRRPASSAAELDTPDEPLTRFLPDAPGTYLVGLTVSDGDFEDTDLVGIHVSRSSTAAEALQLALRPAVCNLTFGTPLAGDCAFGDFARIEPNVVEAPVAPAPTLEWTFLRLPAGLSAADLDVRTSTPAVTPLAFSPARPGAYWLAGRLRGARAVSAPAFATVAVLPPGVPLDGLPRPEIQGPRRARVLERVLLDGRGTTSTSSSTRFRWRLLTDPSDGLSTFTDRATGCPPGQCRAFVPVEAGTYVALLEAGTQTATGAPALWSIEVEP